MTRKPAKILGGIAAAIVLGAIGSGLWETLLSPGLELTVSGVVRLFAALSHTFKDFVYSEAARGFHEKHSLALLVFLLCFFAGVGSGILFSILWGPRGREERKRRWSGLRRHRYAAVVLAASVFIMTLFVAMRESYANWITTWTLASIESLGGGVSPAVQAELRADFYRMRQADDFYVLHRRLLGLAEELGLELRSFKPL